MGRECYWLPWCARPWRMRLSETSEGMSEGMSDDLETACTCTDACERREKVDVAHTYGVWLSAPHKMAAELQVRREAWKEGG